ncbi:hypothetical protein Tco_0696802 [Tanacetum coccineum]
MRHKEDGSVALYHILKARLNPLSKATFKCFKARPACIYVLGRIMCISVLEDVHICSRRCAYMLQFFLNHEKRDYDMEVIDELCFNVLTRSGKTSNWIYEDDYDIQDL